MNICLESYMDCIDLSDLSLWVFYYLCAIGAILLILLIAICIQYFQIHNIKTDFHDLKRTPQFKQYKQLVEKGRNIRRAIE